MSEEPKITRRKSRWSPRFLIILWLILALLLLLAETVGFSILLEKRRQHMPGVFMFSTLGVTAFAGVVLVFALVIPTRLRQRLFNRRMAGRYLLLLASLATAVALFYAEEDWRGRYLWKTYVRQVEAKGERMDFAALAPIAVPDDENLARCPLLKPLLDYSVSSSAPREWWGPEVIWHDTNGLRRIGRLDARWMDDFRPSSRIRANRAEKELDAHPLTNGWINLNAWQNFYRAGTNLDRMGVTNPPAIDVLLALRPNESDLAELQRETDHRPRTRWPVHYGEEPSAGMLLPHLSSVLSIVRTLQLRAAARLASGNTEGALDDMRLGFRLADSVREEPILMSQWAGIMAYDVLMQPLREGLARGQFSDSQLADLQKRLSSADFLQGYHLAMRGERAENGQWSGLTEQTFRDLALHSGDADQKTAIKTLFLYIFAPSGWIYQNQISLCRLEDQRLMPAIDAQARLAYPAQAAAFAVARRTSRGPFNLISKVWLARFLPGSPCQFARGQTAVDQAVIACALERFRLAHGEYPEALDPLAPQFIAALPHDLIGGQPLKYRRAADGTFLLYSIGWNEKDDGGIAGLTKDGKEDPENGDWVWWLPGINRPAGP